MSRTLLRAFLSTAAILLFAQPSQAQTPELEARLTPRVTQEQVENSPIKLIRKHGLRIFATPLTTADGLGAERMFAGVERPEIFGSFTRVFGLDSQSCAECHSIRSADTIPNQYEIGGAGALSNNEIFSSTLSLNLPFAGFFFNPISLFGAGGAQLVGFEMTTELQLLKAYAIANPGTTVQLTAKGVDFGTLVCDPENCDTSNVEGLEEDLVVRPFGHEGNGSTFRKIAASAFVFHFGIVPVELVGAAGGELDPDMDGMQNEISVGEISAMAIWAGSLKPPVELRQDASARRGEQLFDDFSLGCASCHIPEYVTNTSALTFAFPEVEVDPSANVYMEIDLRNFGFPPADPGVRVRVYSDFKTHDLGSEFAGLPVPFVTAKLWGVADTAPYLHDGRATTLDAAILGHGGEGSGSATAYENLSLSEKQDLIAFLKTLRNPKEPNAGLTAPAAAQP